MVIRRIKESHWEHVCRKITTYGRTTPLSLQFDIDINCNEADYIVKVQLEKKRKIVALQVLGSYPNCKETGGREYRLIEDNAMVSALLEIIIKHSERRCGNGACNAPYKTVECNKNYPVRRCKNKI